MWEQIAANKRKSTLLVVTMGLLLLALGWFGGEYFGGRDGGPFGLLIALIVWGVMTLTAWFQGDNVMLSVAGAKRVEKADLPVLFNVVEEMTLAAGLGKMPTIYVIDDPAPNAFATGRGPKHASVAATEGLLAILDDEELEGVMAHELAHVAHRDILVQSVAATIGAAIMMLASMARWAAIFGLGGRDDRDGGGPVALLATALLAPLAAMIIQAAISRSREFAADGGGARIAGTPAGLARAQKNRGGGGPRSNGRKSGYRTLVHHAAGCRKARSDVPVQHPSADRGTNPPLDEDRLNRFVPGSFSRL